MLWKNGTICCIAHYVYIIDQMKLCPLHIINEYKQAVKYKARTVKL